MITLSDLKKELKSKADPEKAKLLQRFFKTGPDEYAQGDIFYGVMVPETRQVAKKYSGLSLNETVSLLHSKIHEERLVALLILVSKFEAGEKDRVYRLYLKNTKYVNNWDLVDLTAHKIMGCYLINKPKNILYKLARSKNLWERRMSLIATFYFIKENKFKDSLKLAETLLYDKHDLIHKALGWMLREIGKKDLKTEEKFLRKYYKVMPRTALRYAIERFPERKRKWYLAR
ncbi:MAG: DNA alkylation repair protein [Candidatus Nealsonbacteria bacterium]